MNETPTQPVELPAFKPWALYGLAWAFSALRILHAALGAKDEEIRRLRVENTRLLNLVLKRQSTETLPVEGEPPRNGHYEPPVRRELKPPIASHNAQAKAIEDAAHRQRVANEQARREAIRRDAEG